MRQQLKQSEVRPPQREYQGINHSGKNQSKDRPEGQKTVCRGQVKGDASEGQTTVRETE